MGKKITVKSLKTGAESLGLKPAKIKDVKGGIEYIKSFFDGEGAELDYDCDTCGQDIPDVDICPFCAEVLEEDTGGDDGGKDDPEPEEKDGGEEKEEETGETGEEGFKEEEPESEEKPKKKTGGKNVAKDKKKGTNKKAKVKEKKTKAKPADDGNGDKMRDLIVETLKKNPLVKKGIAEVKEGASRVSFWGSEGLIAKIFSAKGVAWMYMKESEKKLEKLGASKLHVRKLETPIKGLPTRYDLPSPSEVKNAVSVLTSIAETQAEEVEKEAKKTPKKNKDEKKTAKKAKKTDTKKKTAKKKK